MTIGITGSVTIFGCMKSGVISFKAKDEFRAHLEAKAKEHDLPLGTYIKAALRKVTKYKEKEIQI